MYHTNTIIDLHEKLGHASLGKLKNIQGVNINNDFNLHCQICLLAKQPRPPFSLPKGLHLSPNSGTVLDRPHTLIRLIGRLLYANLTRPNISYVIQHLSQFMHTPRQLYWEASCMY